MDINRDMKTFSLSNEGFTLVNAVLNDKQLRKRTNLKGLTLPPQRSEIKEAVRTLFHISVFGSSAKEKHQGATRDHPGSATGLVFNSVIVRPFKFISTFGS
jgi:hypothetical protein